MYLKRITLVLLLLLTCFCVFADTYKVVDYNYEIDGKTKEAAIKSLIEPSNEIYSSEDELKQAITQKKKILNNLRIFSKILITYSSETQADGSNNVIVDVYLEDASSSILLPYPKYDTNDGLVLGIRYKNANFMGLLSKLNVSVNGSNLTSLNESFFDYDILLDGYTMNNGGRIDSEIYGEVDMENMDNTYVDLDVNEIGMKINDVTLNLGLSASTNFTSLENTIFGFDISESNLKLFNTKLNASNNFQINMYSKDVLLEKYSISYGSVPMGNNGDFSFNLSGYYYNHYEYSTDSYYELSDSDFYGTIYFSNINIGKYVEFSDTPAIDYYISSNDKTIKDTELYTVTNTASFKFKEIALDNLNLVNVVTYNAYKDTVDTETTLYFDPFKGYTLSFLFNSTGNNDNKIGALEADVRLGTNYSFFNGKLRFSPIIGLYNKYTRNNDKFDRKTFGIFSTSATLNGGTINYIDSEQEYFAFRDNYRYGTSYKLTGSFQERLFEDMNWGDADFFARGTLTSFPIKTQYFNPSIRLIGGLSAEERNWFSPDSTFYVGDTNDLYYSYSGSSYDAYTFNYESLQEMLRGITREVAKEFVNSGATKADIMLTGNVSLTTAFLNFEEFGHTYINPFFDFAVFKNWLEDEKEYISSLGFEIIAILDNHPAYPIRVSLGFDTEDLIDKFVKKDDVKIGYEVFIGLGWFY